MSNSREHHKLLLTLMCAQPIMCEGQLQRWREDADRCARAENVLLKYYLRTATPRKQFIPEVMAA